MSPHIKKNRYHSERAGNLRWISRSPSFEIAIRLSRFRPVLFCVRQHDTHGRSSMLRCHASYTQRYEKAASAILLSCTAIQTFMHEPFAFSYASLLRMRTAEALKRDHEGQIERKEKRGGNVCTRTNISARLRREIIGFPVEFERYPRFSLCVRFLSFRER